MKMHSHRFAFAVFGFSLLFLWGPSAFATGSVEATNSFSGITIDPTSGTLELISEQSSAFAQAGANSQYGSVDPSTATISDVPVSGGLFTGAGTASVLSLSGLASATGFVPGTTAGFDTSTGRASLNGEFEIVGVSGSVTVNFSALIGGGLDLYSDGYGESGKGETDFSLSVDDNQVLFFDQVLTIGPDQSDSGPISQLLTGSVTLTADTPYYFVAESDAETDVVNSNTLAVPEPATVSLVAEFLALLALIRVVRCRRAANAANRVVLFLLGGAMLGLATPARAMYIGSDAPDIIATGAQPTRQSAGAINTSLSEGNIREDYPVVTVNSAYGATLTFRLTYNSYNADGSKAQLDTGLGFGWTHTYNTLLFQQRGQMFRLGADGRVTQYFMNYSGTAGTYVSDTGYFETLTKQPDGSFVITNKYQSWWHFGLVPNSPLLAAGPVYQLLQMADRNQNITTMSYDAGGLLTTVTDPFGRTLQFNYNASNKLSSVTDPLGRTTTFQYDPQARIVTQISDPLGNSVQYTYNAQYQMTRKVDRDGRMYFYTYKSEEPFMVTDGNGQPYFSMSNPDSWAVNQTYLAYSLRRQDIPGTTASTDGNGNLWQYAYDTNGYITLLTAPDATITQYTYDPSTRMVSSVTDANGHTTTYKYDAEGNCVQTTDALGNVTTWTYEPVFNQMTSMTDANGHTTTCQYDSHGDRIHSIDPLGKTESWTYDSHGNILSYTDKNANTSTYTYDADGNRASMTDPLGNVTSYQYDGIGNRTQMTEPLGNTTRYSYDADYRPITTLDALGGTTSTTYDGVGRTTSSTDQNGNVTTNVYDARGRLATTTDALGGKTANTYDANDNRISTTDPLGRITSSQYDTQNRVITVTNALGGLTSTVYDPAGNIITSTDPDGHTTSYTYDAINRQTNVVNALNGITSTVYDPVGNVLSRTDANGNTTSYAYDALDRQTNSVDALGGINSTLYDSVGKVLSQTDPNTNTTIYVYDADNRQVFATNAMRGVTATIYDADGNRVAVIDPNTNTTFYVYDALHRQVIMTNGVQNEVTYTAYDPVGNLVTTVDANTNVTTYVYDRLNRRLTQTDSNGGVTTNIYDAVGNVLVTADGDGHTTTYSYDALNRQTNAMDALDRTTSTAYDAVGNIILRDDADTNVTTYAYDALNRQTYVVDSFLRQTITAYDAVGNILSLDDGDGHTTTYIYDALNRRVSETYPDASPRTITYAYDPDGDVILKTNENGKITAYSYDALNQQTSEQDPSDGLTNQFTYDESGRLVAAQRGGWVVTYAYDADSRVTNTTQNGLAISYTYNIPAHIRTATYPSARIITDIYDDRDRLMTVQDNTPNPPIATYTYDESDRVLSRTYRNGVVATYTYDADNRVVSLQHTMGATLIAGCNYAYDNDGNKLYEQKVDNPGDSEAYTYDALDRLTNYNVGTLSGGIIPSPALQKTWTLDDVGNWIGFTSNGVPQTRTYSTDNELTSINEQALYYDGDGNLTNDANYAYLYDQENRLTNVVRLSDSAVVARYFYDAFGRRVMKVTNPGGVITTNVYYYDGDQIIEERDGGGNLVATYTYGNYVDEPLTMDRGGQTYYYHQNAQWSPLALTDANGNPVERYMYDVYGQVTVLNSNYITLPSNSWGTPHSAVGSPWLFTGRQLDEETGIYFYRARYYDSLKGRFLQRDPMGYEEGANLYQYAGSNPANLLDPSGLYKHKFTIVFASADVTAPAIAYHGLGSYLHGFVEIFPGTRYSHTITTKSMASALKQIKETLQDGDTIDEIVVSAHGSAGSWSRVSGVGLGKMGPGNLGEFVSVLRPGDLCPESEIGKAFAEIRGRWNEGNEGVTLQICEQANGESGRDFMIKLAQAFGAKVKGWTGLYAVIPLGDEWNADPAGFITRAKDKWIPTTREYPALITCVSYNSSQRRWEIECNNKKEDAGKGKWVEYYEHHDDGRDELRSQPLDPDGSLTVYTDKYTIIVKAKIVPAPKSD